LQSLLADADGVGLGSTIIADIDIVAARRDRRAGTIAQCDIMMAGGHADAGYVLERSIPNSRVVTAWASSAASERVGPYGRVVARGRIARERVDPHGRVVADQIVNKR
jgi:hypothetical protein